MVQRIFLAQDFSRSTLVRLLGEVAPVDADGARMDFAERLALWLNAFDAIELQAALASIGAAGSDAPARTVPAREAPDQAEPITEDLDRVRAALLLAIEREVRPPDALQAGAGAAAYQQRHLQLQGQMAQMIAPLRARARLALGRGSPRLRQLAALDAVLEKVVGPREQALLPTAAALMQRRLGQLGADAAPGAVQAFDRQWRQVLQAELELRLEPVLGLVEALDHEAKN